MLETEAELAALPLGAVIRDSTSGGGDILVKGDRSWRWGDVDTELALPVERYIPESAIQMIFARELARADEDMETSGHIEWLIRLRDELCAAVTPK